MQRRIIQILMVGPVPYKFGGVSVVSGQILSSDLAKKYDIHYISSYAMVSFPGKVFRFCAGLMQALWLLATAKPAIDIVHIQVAYRGSFYRKSIFVMLAKLFGKKVILHQHFPSFEGRHVDFYLKANRLMRVFYKKIFDWCDVILVETEQWKDGVGAITDNDNIQIIYNPIYCETYKPLENRPENVIKRVLFVGWLSPRKGVKDLIAAAPRVIQQVPDTKFILVGKGQESEVKAWIQEYNMEGYIEHLGFVSTEEKIQQLQLADIYVLPTYAEGFPISILEAMASGLPIVTTHVGGIPDILEKGYNAYLVTPGEVEQLAGAIIAILKDDVLRKEMGARNRRKALAEYDISIFTDRVSVVYEGLLGN